VGTEIKTVAVARNAMATRFEIVLHGADEPSLRAAAEDALSEVERLEAQLSLYRPTSDLARINARAAFQPVRVEPELFNLLRRAARLHEESGGAFDITIAPLMRCWGFMGGSGRWPGVEELAAARAKVGMRHVLLDETELTVRFAVPGMMLDLGAIGKGYAIERAAERLGEAGVTSGLIHGGTSTVYALGQPPDSSAWRIALAHPGAEVSALTAALDDRSGGLRPPTLGVVSLRDEALSVSAVWGKAFEREGKVYGHIIDPRTGEPAMGAVLAAVVLRSATDSDALSTALLTLGMDGYGPISGSREGIRLLVAGRDDSDGQLIVRATGIETSG